MTLLARATAAAQRHSRAGDASRWKVCWCAVVVVGQREPGLTLALARRLNRSVDSVEAMARAALTYRSLHQAFRDDAVVCARLRQIHRTLTWSHFAAIGRPLKAEKIDPLEAFSTLDVAAEHGTPVNIMMGHETGANGQGWVELEVVTDDHGWQVVVLPPELAGCERVRVKERR